MAIDVKEADAMIDRAAGTLRTINIPASPPAAVVEKVRLAGSGAKTVSSPARWWSGLMVRYAAVAAILGVIAGFLGWVNWGNGHAGVAFADVLQQMRQVRTVRYTTVDVDAGKDRWDVVSHDTVDMAGQFARWERMGQGPKGASDPAATKVAMIEIVNRERLLILDVVEKTAQLNDYSKYSNTPGGLGGSDTLADILELSPSNAKPLGERVFDGKKLVGFGVNRDYDRFNKRTLEVWVNPETRLPARVVETSTTRRMDETSQAILATMHANKGEALLTPEEGEKMIEKWPEITTIRTMTDIVFNVPVDESMFSVEMPKGYTVVK